MIYTKEGIVKKAYRMYQNGDTLDSICLELRLPEIERSSLIQHILDGHKLGGIRRSYSCMIRSKQTPYYDNECEYGTKDRYYVFTEMDLEGKIEVDPKHLTIKY
jgi:hypothetical protein